MIKKLNIFLLVLIFSSVYAEPKSDPTTVCASCPTGKCGIAFTFYNFDTGITRDVLVGQKKSLSTSNCDELTITAYVWNKKKHFYVAPCDNPTSGYSPVPLGATIEVKTTLFSKKIETHIKQGDCQ